MAYRPIPRERLPALQKSYGQLCEWLNLENEHLTRRLLDGRYVRPFFEEYCRDFLSLRVSSPSSFSSHYNPTPTPTHNHSHNYLSSVVKCNDLYRWCISTNAFAQPKYADKDAVNKNGWTSLDHATRFVVRVLTYSWSHNGEWSRGKFDPDDDKNGDGELEFFQVWAILEYLQAEWEAANLRDWNMEHLTLLFNELSTSRL